ncbi:MAG: transglycosylase SLT domain-containing protein [Chitinispirillales bacterium]|jgi:pSer/pThr/pTyr-binding forkhead associated (FHA) protein|nr:transglycosylase SLT domain-containing protein [Chitinispirillales bacterium]
MAFFLERTDLRHGGRLPLSGGAVSIGRSPGNTVVLAADDRGASAYHAVIYADPRRMLLQDLQSTNGTFVNGRRIQECVLGPGDEIWLGRSGPKFRVVAEDGINNINVINDVNGIKGISSINDNVNGTDDIDPGSSLDTGLTGLANPIRRGDDGAEPPKRRVAIAAGIATIAVSVAVLMATTLFMLIPMLSQPATSTPKTSKGGKEFFSAPSTPIPTPTSAPTSIPKLTPTSASTTRDRINAVLIRFGEDGYQAPTEMIERVEHYLELYRGPMRGTITIWMERSQRYFPMIRAVFSEKNVPFELAYVSMLESGFNASAVSHAGAAGMWQFMPQTARRYGLRVDGGVDERTDPEKATRAAAAYFKDLIAIFGSRSSTMLCMAAYNAGEQRVINALKRIDDPVNDRDFWHLYRMGWLAKETNEYIPQVIALIIISDNPGEYGFKD